MNNILLFFSAALLSFGGSNNVTYRVTIDEKDFPLEIEGVVSSTKPYAVRYSTKIEHNGSEGVAFIAENCLYSAEHIFTDKNFVDTDFPDAIFLGNTEIFGLHICRQNHNFGDTFGAFLQNGFIKLTFNDMTNYFYKTKASLPVIPGDSGSPVVCIEHLGVIGTVSATGENGIETWIAILPHEKQTSGSEKIKKEEVKKD